MKPECETAIRRAAGRDVSKAELEAIEDRIRTARQDLSVKDHAAYLGMSEEARLFEAAKLAKERMMRDIVRAHEQSVQEATRKNKLFQDVDGIAPGKNGQMVYLKNQVVAVEQRARAIMADYMRRLEGFREADPGRFFGMLQDPAKQLDIVKGLYNENTTPEAKKFADRVNDTLNALADRYIRSGITLNKREDYRTPQPQDPSLVAGVPKAEWVSDHLGLLDNRYYLKPDGTPMTTQELTKMLEESYTTISTDGANRRGQDTEAVSIKSMVIGANKNAPRRLFYKNAESWSAAMNKYGRSSNLYQLLLSHMHSMAKDIAMVETFGRNADANFSQALDRARTADQLAGVDGNTINKMAAQTKHMFDAYLYPIRPENVRFANRASNVRGFISSVLLGNGWLTSAPDLVAMKGMQTLNKMPFMRTYYNTLKNMAPGREKDDYLHRLGIWFEGFQSAHNRLMEEQFTTGWGQFFSDLTYKLMLQNSFDRGTRSGNAMAVMDIVGRYTRDHDSLASAEGNMPFLQNMGVTEEIWKTWREAELETGPSERDSLLAPGKIYNIPDEKLDPIVEEKVKQRSQILKAEIDKRDAQTAREKEWLEKRMDKFNTARNQAYKRLNEFDERRQKMIGEAANIAEADAELMRARLERAEVEHDIAGYLKTETSQARIKRFLERVEDGANVERQRGETKPAVGERAARAVEDYGRDINRIAERLGQKQARTEAKIAAAERRLSEMQKKADAEILRQAGKLDRRFMAALKDIEDTAAEYKERAAKRADYARTFEEKIGKVLDEERMKMRNEAAEKILEVAYQYTQKAARGASGATIADRTAFGMTKLEAGTVMGEILRFGMQFKSVPLGVFRTQMEVANSLPTRGSKMAYLAKMAAGMTLMGALALQARAILNGQDPMNMNPETEEGRIFWLRAMMSGGGFGIWGDIIGNGTTAYGQGVETILGPAFGMGLDAIRKTSEIMGHLAEEEEEKAALKFVQFTRRNAVPLMNVFYLKGAFNRLVYDQLQEMIEPGVVDRHQKRMESRGSSYWWEPGETAPYRAPDLSTAYESE